MFELICDFIDFQPIDYIRIFIGFAAFALLYRWTHQKENSEATPSLPVQYFLKEAMNIETLLGNNEREKMLRLGVKRWVLIRANDVVQHGSGAVTANRSDVDAEMGALGVLNRIRTAIPSVIAAHFSQPDRTHYVLLVQSTGTFPLGIFFATADDPNPSGRIIPFEAKCKIQSDHISGFGIVNIDKVVPGC
jgi:hypothetical protein